MEIVIVEKKTFEALLAAAEMLAERSGSCATVAATNE